MDRLEDALDGLFEGKGTLILLTGEAGVYANEAAIRYNRRALELLEAPGAPETTPETVAEIWEKVGDLAALTDKAGEDTDAYRAAIETIRHSTKSTVLARLHRKAACCYLARHDADSGIPHFLAAETLLPVGADEAERGRLCGVRAHWLLERGQSDQALAAAEEARELAERHGASADMAAAHEILAIILHIRGEWRRGLHLELQRLGPAADDPQPARMFDLHHSRIAPRRTCMR